MREKPSSAHTAKAGNKTNKGKPLPKGAKVSPRSAPKATSKRSMGPPSDSPKRRRTATGGGRILRGKEAEAALEQYGRLMQEDDEYDERNMVRVEENEGDLDDLPDL